MGDNSIKTVIIENCSKSLKYLIDLLSNYKKFNLLGTANSISEGHTLINKVKPHIIFLDIELDDGNAFELLDKLVEKEFQIVFTTAYNEYYPQACEHFAFNYLLKPICPIELDNVIQRALILCDSKQDLV